MTALPLNSVPTDAVNGRAHRTQIATALNAVTQKVFTPNSVNTNTAAGDATTAALRTYGNPVLVVGQINVAAAGATFSLTRNGVTIATWDNFVSGKTVPVIWLDTPGPGSWVYATASGSHTNSAALNAVELK